MGSSPDCACLSCTRVSTSSASPHPLITAKRHPSAGYGKKAPHPLVTAKRHPIRCVRQKGTPSAAYGKKAPIRCVRRKRHPSDGYGEKAPIRCVRQKRHPSYGYGKKAPHPICCVRPRSTICIHCLWPKRHGVISKTGLSAWLAPCQLRACPTTPCRERQTRPT